MNTATLLNFYYDDEREHRDRMARESYVREEGEARGIGMAISMGREFGLSDAEIISRIASKLDCNLEEATRLFQKYSQ